MTNEFANTDIDLGGDERQRVTVHLHSDDYRRAETAARELGYDLCCFIKLSVHQEAVRVLAGRPSKAGGIET